MNSFPRSWSPFSSTTPFTLRLLGNLEGNPDIFDSALRQARCLVMTGEKFFEGGKFDRPKGSELRDRLREGPILWRQDLAEVQGY
jgi:hypothetical protein